MTSRSTPDLHAVAALLAEVSAEIILPRFRTLREDDLERKVNPADPEDLVTVVDRAAEEEITRRLAAFRGTGPVLGEEAAYDRPELLRLKDSDEAFWVLDPIDGTRNYARGDDRFGVMLAWIRGGRARAAWIRLPARDLTFMAEEGGGLVRLGPGPGERPARRDGCRGTLHLRYLPDGCGPALSGAVAGAFDRTPSSNSAAVEHTAILEGRCDFTVFYRLLPWDHAPGAMLLAEHGGAARHLDGTDYHLRSRDQLTIFARDAETATAVRRWLAPAAVATGSWQSGTEESASTGTTDAPG